MPVEPFPLVNSKPKCFLLQGLSKVMGGGGGGGQVSSTFPSIVIAEQEQAAVHQRRRHPCAWPKKMGAVAT